MKIEGPIASSIFNLLRGISGIALTSLLPLGLHGSISPNGFIAIAIALQFSGYIAFFDFGLQATVSQAIASSPLETRARAFWTGTTIMAILSGAATIAIIVCTIQVGQIANGISKDDLVDTKDVIRLIAIPMGIALLGNSVISASVAAQKTAKPTLVILSIRLLSVFVALGAAACSANVKFIAGALGAGFLLQVPLLFFVCLRDANFPIFPIRLSWREGLTLTKASSILALWGIAHIAIQNVAGSLFILYDIEKLVAYTLCLSIISPVWGAQAAILNPLIPLISKLHAVGEVGRCHSILLESTKLVVIGIPAVVVCGIVSLKCFLHLKGYNSSEMQEASWMLLLMFLGVACRLISSPWAHATIGFGEQKKVLVTPLIEAVLCIGFSYIFGSIFGALGVVGGVALGNIIGLIVNCLYNIPRTNSSSTIEKELIQNGVVLPLKNLNPSTMISLTCILAPGSNIFWWLLGLAVCLGATFRLYTTLQPVGRFRKLVGER